MQGHVYPHMDAQVFHVALCRQSQSHHFGHSGCTDTAAVSHYDISVGAGAFGGLSPNADGVCSGICTHTDVILGHSSCCGPFDFNGTACTGMCGKPVHLVHVNTALHVCTV